MKNIAFIVLLLLVLISCTSNSEKNLLLVENYINAVVNNDYEAMDSFLAEDYIGLGPSIADTVGKEQALVNWKFHAETLYERIEYLRSAKAAFIVPAGDNQGEWVSSWAELYIEYKYDYPAVTIRANTLYKIENGKIVKTHTFYNEADALRQLGYVFIKTNDF